MGDPKKKRKQYEKPRRAFQKERIDKERVMKKAYGLKNKRELFRTETTIRTKRATARKLLALALEDRLRREKELLDSLKKIGILRGAPKLDDVLILTPEALLERRLQTIVWRKGMANTLKQARQFIVHGHIAINLKKISKPSYTVLADEEDKISWYGNEIMFEQKKHSKKKDAKKSEKEDELRKAFDEAKPKEAEGNEKKISEAGKKTSETEKKTIDAEKKINEAKGEMK